MIKTITKSYETRVCDICGQEADFTKRIEIRRCLLCGKDYCSNCEVKMNFISKTEGHFTLYERTLCKTHITDDLLMKLIKPEK